ncbi:MAG: hypothetical protein K0S07_836 [Chlamydiales bacterium]|jgi:hypothetical protein|nr:hypothetical protein [Chlamydiales bacterium]
MFFLRDRVDYNLEAGIFVREAKAALENPGSKWIKIEKDGKTLSTTTNKEERASMRAIAHLIDEFCQSGSITKEKKTEIGDCFAQLSNRCLRHIKQEPPKSWFKKLIHFFAFSSIKSTLNNLGYRELSEQQIEHYQKALKDCQRGLEELEPLFDEQLQLKNKAQMDSFKDLQNKVLEMLKNLDKGNALIHTAHLADDLEFIEETMKFLKLDLPPT